MVFVGNRPIGHTSKCHSIRRNCYGCRRTVRVWLCDARDCTATHTGVRPFENYNGNISVVCKDCIEDYYACGGHGRRPIPSCVRKAVVERDGQVCQLCSGPAGKGFHLDHIHPYALGGLDTVDNLRVTCQKCNLGRPKPKRSRPVECKDTRHGHISLAIAGQQRRSMQL